MAKKRDSKPEQKTPEKSVSRRNFLTQGAVAGVSAAALGASVGEAPAQTTAADGIKWDYEVDLVVIGSGASGLPCAIRARDAGLRVLIVDQNFDVGGKMAHSGGQVSLGGGDPCQLRDIAGEADKEGFIKVPPLHKPEEMREDVDFLFRDMTDWTCARRRGAGVLPLQRPRRAAGLGRKLLRHPAIPDGQLCALFARQRHASGRRYFTRPAGIHHPQDRQQDRHEGRNRHAAGRGRRGQELQPFHATRHGRCEQDRRPGHGVERRRAHPLSGVQRAREGHQVHAQPAHDRARSRAAVLRPRPRHQDQLYAAVRPGHRRATEKLYGQRQHR